MEVVCVTGSSGYIASWVVKMLLEEGHTVHATVRDIKSPACEHILSKTALGLDEEKTPGTLKIFSGCDLLKEGSFDEAMQGCTVCIHTASPFLTTHAKGNPENDLIKPAVNGTMNVLNSVNKSESVKRVVLTSSIVAIASSFNRKPENAPFTDADWNTQDTIETDPYPLSKRLAEEKAWEMMRAQDRWTMSTIHPGFVMGPVLSSRTNDGSIGFMKDAVLKGKLFFAPELSLAMVDVRDVAKAHVLAMKRTDSARYILTEGSYFMKELGGFLRPKYGGKFLLLPRASLPNFVAKIALPLVSPFTKEYLDISLGVPFLFDNSKTKKDLGIDFIPTKTSLEEMVQSMIDRKII